MTLLHVVRFRNFVIMYVIRSCRTLPTLLNDTQTEPGPPRSLYTR